MATLKRVLKNLIYILGFSATLASFYLTIYNPLTELSAIIKIILILLFMLVNFGVAFVLGWPLSKINLKISNKIDLNIYYDDLFNQNGIIIIIPVNEYFDTLVDERIISSSTVHGQFIKKYLVET